MDHEWPIPDAKLRRKLAVPSQGRLYYIRYALKMGWTIDQIYELTKIDRWFLAQMKQLVEFEDVLVGLPQHGKGDRPEHRVGSAADSVEVLRRAKELGYSDVQLAHIWGFPSNVDFVRQMRYCQRILPVFKLVDTCAAEFEASTPYYYSCYERGFRIDLAEVLKDAKRVHVGGVEVSTEEFLRGREHLVDTPPEDELRGSPAPKVVIIGGGPNRIGQGIEFDYCCVQASFAMRELGIESVMVNSNPETVSTDYDTSDYLFFEPLTHENVFAICERINGNAFRWSNPPPEELQNRLLGVIVQFGGQTPLNLARGLQEAGVPILGTTVASLDAAGDREQFRALLQKLGLRQPENGIVRNAAEARDIARRIGYPVLVRPSFVLGGRAMEIVSDEAQLNYYMTHAVEAAGTGAEARIENPILIDKFVDNATEVDVDCLADYDPVGATPASPSPIRAAEGDTARAIIIGVMEHIEEAGIHSGDSACALPPYSLPAPIIEELKRQTRALAAALRVRGLMNVQYAIKGSDIYVIEVNPRASRTVPFVSKATGVPWAKIAAKVMAGKSLAELGVTEIPDPKHMSVKEVVFPFAKFPGVDVILGPEMRSTGEVMGIDQSFEVAFAKSQMAAGSTLPLKGTVFISVRNEDKAAVLPIARMLADGGFALIATGGTYDALSRHDIPAERISKLSEGRPNIQDYIKNAQVHLIINTPTKKGPQTDEGKIRAMAVLHRVPMVTTITGASAAARAIRALQQGEWGVQPLQQYFPVKPK